MRDGSPFSRKQESGISHHGNPGFVAQARQRLGAGSACPLQSMAGKVVGVVGWKPIQQRVRIWDFPPRKSWIRLISAAATGCRLSLPASIYGGQGRRVCGMEAHSAERKNLGFPTTEILDSSPKRGGECLQAPPAVHRVPSCPTGNVFLCWPSLFPTPAGVGKALDASRLCAA